MRNPLRVRFVRDVALTGGVQGVQALFALVAGILVARYLGPSARGTLSVLVALGTMTVLLASFGLQFSGVYFLGRFKSERDEVLSNTAVVGVLGGIATGVGLIALGLLFRRELIHGIALGIFLLYVTAVPCSYFNAFARSAVLGSGRVEAFNVPVLIEGGGLLAGTAAAIVLFGDHLIPLVILRVLIEASISTFLFVYVVRAIGFRFRPSPRVLRRQLRYGLRNYASSLLWQLLLQSDLILCNYFLGSGATGVYSVAVSLGLPITILAGVVGTLTFQRASAEDDRETRVTNTNRTMRLFMPILALPCAILGFATPWLVPFIFGHRFSAASTALILLLPGLFALSLELVPINFLGGEGSPPIVYWGPMLGLVTNIGANLFVIPRWGINGASVTSSICYGAVLVVVLGYYLRTTHSRLRDVLLVRPGDLTGLWSASDRHRSRSGRLAPSQGWAYILFLLVAWLVILAFGGLVGRGHSLIPVVLLGLAGVCLLGLFGRTSLIVLITTAVLVQPPVASAGSATALQLSELIVPILLLTMLLRTAPAATSSERPRSFIATSRTGPRLLHIALAAYAAVIVANVFRSEFLLQTAHIKRPYYAYFVAVGVYVILYHALTSLEIPLDRLIRVLYVLSLIMSLVGIASVLFHIQLNFGSLRYSVYDYTSGAVRVGFLETFGIAGLAIVATRPMRLRLASGLVFGSAIVYSGGRSASLGVVLALLAYFLIARRGRALLAVAAMAIALPFAYPFLQNQAQFQRLTNVNQRAFASDERAYYYRESLHAFERHPIFGTGFGVPAVVPAPDQDTQQFYEEQFEFGGHATYHSLLKNFGLAGFVPFVLAIGLALAQLARLVRNNSFAGFFFIVLIAQAVSMYAGGNGSDPVFFFFLAGAAATIARAPAPVEERAREGFADYQARAGYAH